MPTTQLFAELLIIGVGVMTWIALFVAAAFKLPLPNEVPELNAGVLFAITGLAYVVGIMFDRLARDFWSFLHRPPLTCGLPTDLLERKVCRDYERLWVMCVYNRSRLRICRSWALNFVLITIAYIIWSARVDVDVLQHWLGVLPILVALCILAVWATVQLNKDYFKELNTLCSLMKAGSQTNTVHDSSNDVAEKTRK